MVKSAITTRCGGPALDGPRARVALAKLEKQNHARRRSPAHRGSLAALAESASKHAAPETSGSKCGILRPESSISPRNAISPTKLESTTARDTVTRSTTSPATESPARTRLGSKITPIRARTAPAGSGSARSGSASRSRLLVPHAATPKATIKTRGRTFKPDSLLVAFARFP